MRFQKGQPRSPNAGRKKGSKNKKKLLKVSDVLAEADLQPVQEIIDLLSNGDLKDRDRLDAWFNLLSYCQAKPKEAAEDQMDDEGFLESLDGVSNESLLKIVKPDGAP